MNEWSIIKLKDVCERVTVGYVGAMADQYVISGVPFLRSLNIRPYRISLDKLMFIGEAFDRKIKKSALRPGDVAIVRTGYPGVACVIPKSLPHSNCSDLVIVRPAKGLNPHFLCAIFNSTFGRDVVAGNLVGAAQQHFNITVAKELKFRIPDRLVQDKIAAVLVAYDDLIENNRQRMALLEGMAEQLYREWFLRFRFPGHEKAKFAKGVPADWKPSSLGQIVTSVMGQSPKSEFYNEVGDGLPFHQGVGTYGDRFPRNVIFCSSEGRRAKSGDILFSVRAPVGRLNIADCEMIIGRGVAAMRHKDGLNAYLFNLLKVTFANEDMIGNGAIFNSVSKDELYKFPVYAPDPALVRKFDGIAKEIDLQIEILSASTRNLIATRDLLLPRLISGKLRVDDLDIQFPLSMQDAAA